jgi:hypothetical protein
LVYISWRHQASVNPRPCLYPNTIIEKRPSFANRSGTNNPSACVAWLPSFARFVPMRFNARRLN